MYVCVTAGDSILFFKFLHVPFTVTSAQGPPVKTDLELISVEDLYVTRLTLSGLRVHCLVLFKSGRSKGQTDLTLRLGSVICQLWGLWASHLTSLVSISSSDSED